MRRPDAIALRTIAVLAAAGLIASCAGQQVRGQAEVLKQQIDKARASGAKRCAPRELAVAEANLIFADTELEYGNAGRAEEHVATAAAAILKALEDSKDCGPTKVLIKKPAVVVKVEKKDTDGDGLYDPDDRCPLEHEDKDAFQDEDGCPDLDNDQDGLTDDLDRCANEAGPAGNDGCPVYDTDFDGIPDDTDRCPRDPEDKDAFEDEDGCPELDNDKDGLVDAQDKCPNEPGPATNQGCPVLDKDGDGIRDEQDRCPQDPEDKDAFEDEDGCPEPDNDKDEILDKDDKCPVEPGIPELQGCAPKDRDGDNVPDHFDQCPDDPGVLEEQGCPRKYTLVVLKKEKIEISEQVHFDTNKSKILKDSFALLDQVAQVLKDNPKLKVRIEGHTDSKADDNLNLKLSQSRADAVREYLVKKGAIAGARLVAKGYGETMPIASNVSEKGRAANRRVEFNIVEP